MKQLSMTDTTAINTTDDSAQSPRWRHQAFYRMYANGLFGGASRGVATTTLVIYLALELKAGDVTVFGVTGMAISWIIALPGLLGIMRQVTPGLIDKTGNRRAFCIVSFFMAAFFWLMIPCFALVTGVWSPSTRLKLLVVLWCLYQLSKIMGEVAFWSWIGDLAPRRIRGRFLGWRNLWRRSGQVVGTLFAGLFVYCFNIAFPLAERWEAYVIPATVGGLLMVLSVFPLIFVPRCEQVKSRAHPFSLSRLLAPLCDRRFGLLAVFGCWLAFFNGITQSSQFSFMKAGLGFTILFALYLSSGLRAGQLGLSPLVGKCVDRLGGKWILIGSQLIAATGPFFFLVATVSGWEWVVVAHFAWISYVGVNISLSCLILKLAPPEDNAPFIAGYYALSGVCFGLGTLAGGLVFSMLKAWSIDADVAFFLGLSVYQVMFLTGWITRSMSVLWLLPLKEE